MFNLELSRPQICGQLLSILDSCGVNNSTLVLELVLHQVLNDAQTSVFVRRLPPDFVEQVWSVEGCPQNQTSLDV